MKKLIAISVMIISGCATVGSHQADCEKTNQSFEGIVSCTKNAILSDGRLRNDGRVKLYLLKSEQLLNKVKSNEISELDARIQLQELYLSLKGEEDSEKRKNAFLWSLTKPKTTNTTCTGYGNSANCISTQY